MQYKKPGNTNLEVSVIGLGSMTFGEQNSQSEAFDVGDTFSGVNFEKGLEAVEELKRLVPDNFSLSELALKWILMHDAVSVVIPGAVNKSQVQMNANVSDLEDISYLLPKINSIYDELIKPEVHNRW